MTRSSTRANSAAVLRLTGGPPLLALAAGTALLLVFAPTVWSAFVSEEAGTEPVRICLLGPFAAAWLLWHRRRALAAIAARSWWPGLLGVAAGAATWTLGELSQVNFLRQLAVVAMLWSSTLAILGVEFAGLLALPFALLLFCVNAFFPLVGPLMRLDGLLTAAALRLTGIPVRLDDLTLVTPFARWRIIEGCSGLDYVLVFAMSALVFGSIAMRSPARRIALVAASIGAAVLANALRTWAIVYATRLRGGVDQGHELFGYAAYSLALVLLFAAARHFAGRPDRETPVAAAPAPRQRLDARAWVAGAALAIAAAAPVIADALERRAHAAGAAEGCREIDRAPYERDGIAVVRMRFRCGGAGAVEQARRQPKAILSSLSPDGSVATGHRTIRIEGRDTPVEAATLTALEAAANRRITFWYEIGGVATGSSVELKWQSFRRAIAGRNGDVDLVAEVERPGAPR